MSSPRDEGAEPPAAGSSRAVADILREAGISTTGVGGRRRRREASEADSDSPSAAEPPSAHDPAEHFAGNDFGIPLESFGIEPGSIEPGSLASYLLADRDPGPAERVVPDKPAPRTDTGPVLTAGWAATPASSLATTSNVPPATQNKPADSRGATTAPVQLAAARASTAKAPVSPAKAPVSPDDAEPVAEPTALVAEPGTPAAPAHATRSSSPLATTAADPDDDDASLVRGGAASWAILGVELLASLGLGVAAWYAFSALWELLPYVAAFAGPLVVTGLVAVAGALRSRTGRNPLGLPTLCLLVFAGTVLVVLPAATVIVP